MTVLKGLEPAAVFRYFEEICSIPHISFHEKALSDYCVDFAKARNLYCEQDALGNVLIISDATEDYENTEPLMIQGHLDMVGDKAPGCPLDMEKDGLKLMIDGDYITADGTTLGADDGIAVAYALAALDDHTLPHPRLEVLLTVSEEVGLLGASGMDLSSCRAKRLLNIDSEIEGIFTVGCAGGRRAQSDIPMTREHRSGLRLDFRFEGISGGHSGIEIDKGLANANALLGRFLLMLKERTDFSIISMNGGIKENVIPKDASMSLLISDNALEAVTDTLADFQKQVHTEYASSDPDIALIMQEAGNAEVSVLTDESAQKVLTALNLMPNGVQTMSMDLPGLVETSLNMGVMELSDDNFQLCFSIRSAVTSAKVSICRKIAQLTEYLGGSISYTGEYPAWPFARESAFRDSCVEIFKAQYGKEPEIVTIHAGLECGIFSEKVPGLDCISIGPDMKDIHTINERLSISSTARVWEFIKAVISAG
ncbi:MAG: aminoacyl-histidine dipeptidase [Lachnospiraceae bacterium]